MNKTAIILGATGLTGGVLLDILLNDATFGNIKIFGRSSVGKTHPKLEEHLGDLFEMEQFPACQGTTGWSEAFKADIVFCCIGTTKAKTPDKETYKKIDYGIPVAAASLAKQNGIDTFLVISAMGANPKSSTFYNKVKGEVERDVLQQAIKNTYIFKPSLIGGEREEERWGERMAQIAFKYLGFLVPKKYKMIEPDTIAKAMRNVAINGHSDSKIESDEILKLSN